MDKPILYQTPEELENHLERARENLLHYIRQRSLGVNEDIISKAVRFSILAHKNQLRKSGVPYVEHPFEVAKLLSDFNMDTTSIVAGLLHDVVEDSAVSLETIKSEFGEEVAFLVDGVTKISAIQTKSRIEQQAETFRKMLLSMAKDFRVIMIKLADRTHNMRTLGYMKEDKKKLIAQETMEVYAPLAHRFGLSRIRFELEDLAFRTLNLNAYRDIVNQITEKKSEREAYIRNQINPISKAISEGGIQARIYGRPKHIYSIYKKTQERNCRVDDLYDLLAFRVVVKTIGECYGALGIVHNLWPPLQSRFKDYIATPKSNMYQSLHTTLVGPQGKPLEIQIRTEEMELTAENGIAAHWAYKENKDSQKVLQESKWLKKFLEWQEELKDSAEFMDFFKIDLNSEDIFVFTPKGDVFQLPLGSTILDFAFAIHSEVGRGCIGAKINNRIVPLDKVLNTGDTVEILKSDSQRPSRDWLRIVTSPKAKNNIRKYLRESEEEQCLVLGKELVDRALRNAKITKPEPNFLDEVKKRFQVNSLNDFYKRVGAGEFTVSSLNAFAHSIAPRKTISVFNRVKFKKDTVDEAVLVSGMDNMLVRFATCCQPIPGDPIIGFVTRGRGVSIHRANCMEGQNLIQVHQDRSIPVLWRSAAGQKFEVFLEVKGTDREGLLEQITRVISGHNINIIRASIATVGSTIRNRFVVSVNNLDQLDDTFKSLKKIKEITSVTRKIPGRHKEDIDPDFQEDF